MHKLFDLLYPSLCPTALEHGRLGSNQSPVYSNILALSHQENRNITSKETDAEHKNFPPDVSVIAVKCRKKFLKPRINEGREAVWVWGVGLAEDRYKNRRRTLCKDLIITFTKITPKVLYSYKLQRCII